MQPKPTLKISKYEPNPLLNELHYKKIMNLKLYLGFLTKI